MKLGIGSIRHKTNTFAKNGTSWEDFATHEHLTSATIIDHYRETPTVLGGVLQAGSNAGVKLFPLVATSALPGGLVDRQAFDTIVERLLDSLANLDEPLDGLILEMHGAMVAEDYPAADEFIVRRVREEYPNVPIAVVLDAQANVTDGLVSHADIILGYDPYSPESASKRGNDAVAFLRGIISGDHRAICAMTSIPMLIPLQASYTGRSPMQELQEAANLAAKRHDICDVSIFSGFPLADVPHAGASVVVLGSGDNSDAKSVADELANGIRTQASAFTVFGYNVEEAIHNAMASRTGPVLLADLGDNPGNGAPGDGTTLLWALLDLGVRQASLATIVDPQAVDACVRAGIGSRVEIPLGGRMDTRHGYPIDVHGYVRNITDGTFTNQGPLQAGTRTDLGRTVLLELEARHEGHVEVIVCENRVEPADANVFRHVGIEPAERQMLAVKSDVRLRENYRDIAVEIYDVIAPGITTPDPAFYEYRNVRRPIFPLDPI